MKNFRFLSKDKISQLPKTAGVYAFSARGGSASGGKKDSRFLYIGKAKNLRERIKNHAALLSQVKQVRYIETDSEIEALLLEAKLIKKYQPKHNVAWRDDKNYFYVGMTKEEFPRVFITHRVSEGNEGKDENKVLIAHQPKNVRSRTSNIEYVGPFVDGKALKKALEELRKRSPYRTCKTLPKKPCLWYHLGRCLAPCLLLSQRIEAYDISNIQGKLATGAMVTFIKGKPDKTLYRRFKIKISGKPNDTAMVKEILQRRLKHTAWSQPDLILIDGGIAQLNAALKVKSQISNLKSIKVMSLAKKENKLFIEGQKKPVLLKSLPREIFNLILQLRDEAHRFARKYHHILRVKELIGK